MKIAPAFDCKNVAVAFAINDFYVPIFGVVLSSLVKNSNAEYNYDILVLEQDVTEENRQKLQKVLGARKNFSLRFIDVSKYQQRFEELWTHGHFVMETWYRLVLPEVLTDYRRILYLDADLIILDDVAKLFETKIDGKLLAATKDADTAGLYNGYNPDKKQYMDEALKLKNPYNYFQAGVILFNLAEFRATYTTDEMLRLAASRNWALLDQDVLNVLADGRVKFVDMSWNVMYDWDFIRQKWIIGLAPRDLRVAYDAARKSPKIIHYAGPDKPWNEPTVDFGKIFWEYAMGTEFERELLQRMPGCMARGWKKMKKRLRKIGHCVFPSKIRY